MLVYYEYTNTIEEAIKREKQLKKWDRNWKLALIEKKNAEWKDLYGEIIQMFKVYKGGAGFPPLRE